MSCYLPEGEKTSQSGQEEEKSRVETQDMSIKSCSGRLDFSRIHWCNMVLWRALALLSMMVPAAESERQGMINKHEPLRPRKPENEPGFDWFPPSFL